MPRAAVGLHVVASAGGGGSADFPKRPDLSILNDTIPLFYIGQNQYGLWIAREAEGRCGGLFVRRQSALRFARERSEPSGCATMFLADPVELDIDNQGSRVATQLSNGIRLVRRWAPGLALFLGMAITEWRKLVAEVSRALAGRRRNRDAVERELFGSAYWLSSKNDDDLPIVE